LGAERSADRRVAIRLSGHSVQVLEDIIPLIMAQFERSKVSRIKKNDRSMYPYRVYIDVLLTPEEVASLAFSHTNAVAGAGTPPYISTGVTED
jgi:hypothetical protein